MARTTTRRVTILTLLAALGLTACGTAAGQDEGGGTDSPHAATELRYPLTATLPSLDPHMNPGGVTAEVGRHIYESLVAYDAELVPQPALAERWESNEDGSHWTFYLRPGVTFHNGEPLTATDVAASLNKWKASTPRAQTFMGEAEFAVVDETTVELVLDEPRGDVLDQLANPLQFAAIMPASVVNEAGADGVSEFIGTGPYEFVDWAPDQYVHTTRFEDYVGSTAEPSGLSGRKDAPTKDIYFEIVPDDATRFASFLSGHYDIVNVSHDQVPQIEAAADTELHRYAANQFAVVFNVTSPAGSNHLVRQAVNAAIDADEFLTAVVSDPNLYRLNPSFAFEENATWWSDAGAEGVYNQGDPQRAADLFEQSGYDGEPLRILTTRDYGGVFYAGAVILQSQLAQAGIEAEIDVYDYATLLQHRNSLSGWDIYTGSFLVPSTPTQLLYLTPNYGGLDDPQVTELLGAAAEALTPEAKAAAAADLSAYLWEQLPVLMVGDLYTYRAVRDTVSGFDFFDGSSVLWNVRVDQ